MPTRRGGLQHIRIKAKEGARKSLPDNAETRNTGSAVPKISAKDSVLFLWATAPCLTEAFELIGAWGFTYKTVAFTWIKQCRKSDRLFTGLGYYTRANAEYCLLATRGKILERKSRSVSAVIVSHIEEHSKKPDEARARIEALYGEVPKIELFARQTVGGWDCWGNETEKFGRH